MNAPRRAFHNDPATKLTIMSARIHGRRGVSCDARFDDSRYWRFERDSRLPIGYFDRPFWERWGDRLALIVPLIGVVAALWWQW